MRIAITGGTGFVGAHLARRLVADGHEVVTVSRRSQSTEPLATEPLASVTHVAADLSRVEQLVAAFAGCDAIVHCAGINREIGPQTYQAVHVEGTQRVVDAARRCGIRKIVLMSFLRARPHCGSAYHESKWAAEEIVRGAGVDYTVVKAGMVYGRGDHMLDHLSHTLYTLPVFAAVGCRERPIRPLAIDDLTTLLGAALVDGRLARTTVAVTGAEELLLSDAVRRIARVVGKRVLILRLPVGIHYLLASIFERVMRVPLVAWAQVRMLAEGEGEPPAPYAVLPADLIPSRGFTDEQIRGGLPAPGGFRMRDLLCSA